VINLRGSDACTCAAGRGHVTAAAATGGGLLRPSTLQGDAKRDPGDPENLPCFSSRVFFVLFPFMKTSFTYRVVHTRHVSSCFSQLALAKERERQRQKKQKQRNRNRILPLTELWRSRESQHRQTYITNVNFRGWKSSGAGRQHLSVF